MYFKRALHHWFLTAVTWLVLSQVLMAHPGTDVAIVDLTALINSSPQSAELRLRRATCYVEHQRWSEALDDIDHAARLSPDHPDLALARAEYFLARDEPLASINALASHLISHPGDAAARILRARASARSGNTLGAQNDFQHALRYLPELELQLARTDSALQRLTRLAAHAERPETYHRRRGDILFQANRLTEARRAYTDALAAIDRLPEWLRLSEPTQQLIAQLTPLATSPL